jgi:1-acyl-sn-glycerol-3-phosphate acyltransferase
VGRNILVYSLTRWLARQMIRLVYRVEWSEEVAIPREGPVIILPKHQYWTDIPLVSLSFAFPLFFVAKKELFRYPGIRSYMSFVGGLPIDRERSVRTLSSIRALRGLLKASGKIVVFPEGTYYRDRVGPGKSRLIEMVLKGQAAEGGDRIPFIPVGIRYGGREGWRRRVEVRIGRPLFAGSGEDAGRFTASVMDEIRRLSSLPSEPEEERQNPKRKRQSAKCKGEDTGSG